MLKILKTFDILKFLFNSYRKIIYRMKVFNSLKNIFVYRNE